MSKVSVPDLPLLLTIDGEAKTAKTTAADAMCAALKRDKRKASGADAGAFFRRMTICALEKLGHDDLNVDGLEVEAEALRSALSGVIATDAAFVDRTWPSLQSKLVERYVSVIGNMTEAQDAMDNWYDKLVEITTTQKYELLVINARNPRERLREWQSPALDLVVYCEPRESARRIWRALGVNEPSTEQLNQQTSAVERRRELDRHKDKYPYIDPRHVVEFVGASAQAARQFVDLSWELSSAENQTSELPATIRLNTTHINLEQTRTIIAALARAAVGRAEQRGRR